jgi:hypothetical protein
VRFVSGCVVCRLRYHGQLVTATASVSSSFGYLHLNLALGWKPSAPLACPVSFLPLSVAVSGLGRPGPEPSESLYLHIARIILSSADARWRWIDGGALRLRLTLPRTLHVGLGLRQAAAVCARCVHWMYVHPSHFLLVLFENGAIVSALVNVHIHVVLRAC